ncbi:MAG: hypothetical protein LBR77_10190 [Lachnospiraceae bacterium]|nr:hypothetical protein [Lachnospiraceae bacterium]
MENIISKLSEIESSASAVMDDALAQKKAMESDFAKRRDDFDAALDASTEEQLAKLRKSMEESAQKTLGALRAQAEDTLHRLDELYETRHEEFAGQIFSQLTAV